MNVSGPGRINISRLLIGLVIFFNLQAAILFIISPAAYSAGFEVGGVVGEKLIQGMGILFLMWNVPYMYALINPIRHRTSLHQAIIMQAIGVVGETILWLTLPSGHPAMESTVIRFAIFDGSGLIALWVALWIARPRV